MAGPGVKTLETHNIQPGQTWTCPNCKLRSSQTDEESWSRHLKQLHLTELEEQQSGSSDEYSAWYRHITAKAFGFSSQQTLATIVPKTLLAPIRDSSKLDIQLSVMPVHEHSSDPLHAPQIIIDDASLVAQASTSLEISQNHISCHEASVSATTSILNDPSFTHYNSQYRAASRGTIDPDDEVRREGRQKALRRPSSPPFSDPQHRGVVGVTDSRFPDLILQPDSRGISQEQLATEVRTIYSGLTALETECIKLDKEQAIATEKGPIPANTWRALISIHRALLNDHHDFFLASQHVSAAPPLHRLAVKYNMPARMWKHGIHSLLELLRRQLPHSIEFMKSFIYLAYQMMSLFFETVPSFEDTWIECLGDLSRYRMIVEGDPRDRETWSTVARYWYCEAAGRIPNTGRLYYHLAILARPNALQQSYLYTRSLISAQPFLSARESIQTLFEPVIRDGATYIPEVDTSFIKIAANIFYRRFDQIKEPMNKFHQLLDPQISKVASKWREYGVYIAGTTIGALFDFGNKNTLLRNFELGNYLAKELNFSKDCEVLTAMRNPYELDTQSEKSFECSCELFFSTFAIVLQRSSDSNTHPYLHVVLCFILTLVSFYRAQYAFPELQAQLVGFLTRLPWNNICRFFNTLLESKHFGERFETFDFLRSERGDPGPLAEDYLLRGLVFTQTYYPSDWFNEANPDNERLPESASTIHQRGERLLWIGYNFTKYGVLIYDPCAKTLKPDETSPCIQGVLTEPRRDSC